MEQIHGMSQVNEQRTVTLAWAGKEYELRYTFSMVRRLRAEGIMVPTIFYAIMKNSLAAAEYGDEIAYVVAWLLREAGCQDVKDEDIWRHSLGDKAFSKACLELFMWMCVQHFAQSENVPPKKPRALAAAVSAATQGQNSAT
jgi:hypothetical protein